MDDTQTSKASDAAATRKRRSSILKSQRTTRTPFSDLEFHVATPTDAAKSRRVSFSRRTGVAEFATNEATTTWKNFYEEHNKSLESSGNESGSRQPLGHIGKRVFDQQFEEVEAVDLMGSLHPAPNISSSLNFDQLASECTDDLKLTAPSNKFELSAFTNQTNIFGEHTVRGEVTDRMVVDFSAIQNIGGRDDLDEIQEDLKRPQYAYQDRHNISEYIEVDLNMTHAVNEESDMSITETLHSPKVQDVSKNKEKQKNTDWVVDKENIAMVNPYIAPRETDNFAITEDPDKVLVFDGKRLTIQSEKKKKPEIKDYRQTLLPNADVKVPQRKTLVLNVNDDLPNFIDDPHINSSGFIGVHSILDNMPSSNQNKKEVTVIYDDNLDIMPTNNPVPSVALTNSEKRRTILYEDDTGNISVTQAVPTNILSDTDSHRIIVYDKDDGNLSVTQVLPANIRDKRNTIVFEDQGGDISVTQALPANIILDKTKRRTIVYEDDTGNLSITKAVPNILITETKTEKRRTIAYEDDTGNISITQAIPSNIIIDENSDRRRTVVFESDNGNLSVTQAVPSSLILREKTDSSSIPRMEDITLEDNRRKAIIYENKTGNLSITQAAPSQVINGSQAYNSYGTKNDNNKRRTIVFDDDAADISMTQALSGNKILNAVTKKEKIQNEEVNDDRNGDTNKRTIDYGDNTADILMAQALSPNQVMYAVTKKEGTQNEDVSYTRNTDSKRRTIVFDNEKADISMTQAVSANQVMYAVRKQEKTKNEEVCDIRNTNSKRRTIVFDNDTADISMTQAVSANQIMYAVRKQEKTKNEEVSDLINTDSKRRTIVFDNDTADISMTQAVSANQVMYAVRKQEKTKNEEVSDPRNTDSKRRTIVFDNDTADISMTQAVSANQVMYAAGKQEKTKNEELSDSRNTNSKRRTIVFDNDTANISMTQAVSASQVMYAVGKQEKTKNEEVSDTRNTDSKRRTVVFDNDTADISMTQAVAVNQVMHAVKNHERGQTMDSSIAINTDNERKTIVFANDAANISIPMCAVRIKDEKSDVLEAQAAPMHQVIDALKENKAIHTRRTVLSDTDNNITANEAVTLNQVIPGKVPNIQDDLQNALNEALHNKNAKTIQRIIDFDQDFEDKEISMIKTTVFSEHTSVTEAVPTQVLEGNSKNNITHVSTPVVDITMADVNESDRISETGSEKSKSISNNSLVDRNDHQMSMSNKSNIENIDVNKSINNYINVLNNGETSKDISEVFVYQTTTTVTPQKVIKQTEQGDSKSQEPGDSEKISTSSKILDVGVKSVEKANIDKDQELNVQDAGNSEMQSDIIEPSQDACEERGTMAVMATEARSQQSEHSVLNDLLDMSSPSMEFVEENLGLKCSQGSTKDIATSNEQTETNSNDTLFYITKDVVETELIEQNPESSLNEDNNLSEESHFKIENKEPEVAKEIQNKLAQIQNTSTSSSNRHFEQVISSDLVKNERKSFKTANDTKELLEMLSDLTDKSVAKLEPHMEEDEEKPEPQVIKRHLSLGNKCENTEPRRLSFATRRQSIVLSREDLLNNISMAGAALKSHLDFNDTELEDSTNLDNTTEQDNQIDISTDQLPKVVRVSRDIVKTLNFDDSVTETNIDKITPLKKTAFGESTYMQEGKLKVIPDYLKNVSDGIKELMDDLVKPTTDGAFDRIDKLNKVPSTCSTQIQANLVTSSQIDINGGNYSDPDSVHDVNRISSVDIINEAVNRSVSRAMKRPINTDTCEPECCVEPEKAFRLVLPSRETNSPGRVLIFDHNNPLNNVLLAPDIYTDVHRYNPGDSTETICVSERCNSAQISLHEKENCETARVSTQYNVGSLGRSVLQAGDGQVADTASVVSNVSKTVSMDQSTQKISDVRDIEVNTIIAMKGNNELLETSSSLTLVDDALKSTAFDIDMDSKTTSQDAPVKVIYAVAENDLKDSDLTSEDDAKPKKRVYSASKRDKHKHCKISSLDVTPKPAAKVPRPSDTPPRDTEKSERGGDKKMKGKRPGTSITVQQLMTEYNVDVDQTGLDEEIKGVLLSGSSVEQSRPQSQSDVASSLDMVTDVASSVDMVTSFTSSKNLRSNSVESASSKVSRMEWRSEEMEEAGARPSRSDADCGANVVAKIDMMPFMGSHDCEWESSSGDTWMFRLLHSRLRLCVRLEHRHENSTRSRVRADTPVRHLGLETLPHDTKSTVALLGVRFAAETMRYFVSRGCACAGDVPALVRRCAAAARIAARWARLMAEAQLRLAFKLTPEGALTLKVANIPLRSVWEVSLQLELVVSGSCAAPWVSAGEIRVRRVLPCEPGEVKTPLSRAPLLPEDWSHAPRTIWRIFKYLKNKSREDEEIFMGFGN